METNVENKVKNSKIRLYLSTYIRYPSVLSDKSIESVNESTSKALSILRTDEVKQSIWSLEISRRILCFVLFLVDRIEGLAANPKSTGTHLHRVLLPFFGLQVQVDAHFVVR